MTPDLCDNCKAKVQLNEHYCPVCGLPAGYPNVKLALAERMQLLERSRAARVDADQRGCQAELLALEQRVQRSSPVVNVSAAFAHDLLTRAEALYASYEALVRSRARRPAAIENDRNRRAVGAKLYGEGPDYITYAALSLDGRGLTSYGPVSLRLRDLAVQHRATVLEENSYTFAQRKQLKLLDPVPQGHLSTWQDRHELAVAKLTPLLAPNTTEDQLDKLLLRSEGDRATDEFLEVHIWGSFNRESLDSVHVAAISPHYADPDEQALAEHLLALAKNKAIKQNIAWSPA